MRGYSARCLNSLENWLRILYRDYKKSVDWIRPCISLTFFLERHQLDRRSCCSGSAVSFRHSSRRSARSRQTPSPLCASLSSTSSPFFSPSQKTATSFSHSHRSPKVRHHPSHPHTSRRHKPRTPEHHRHKSHEEKRKTLTLKINLSCSTLSRTGNSPNKADVEFGSFWTEKWCC